VPKECLKKFIKANTGAKLFNLQNGSKPSNNLANFKGKRVMPNNSSRR